MIVVDSRVWINYFNGQNTPQVEILDQLLSTEPLAIGDLILTEVLQGFRQNSDFETAKQLFLALTICQVGSTQLALRSAENFRSLRKRGITIRKTIDTMIATFCIENNHTLLFSDRDFVPFIDQLNLRAFLVV